MHQILFSMLQGLVVPLCPIHFEIPRVCEHKNIGTESNRRSRRFAGVRAAQRTENEGTLRWSGIATRD